MGKLLALLTSISIIFVFHKTFAVASIADLMSRIDDAKMQKTDDLREMKNSKYYQALLHMMPAGDKQRWKRQIESRGYLEHTRIFTKLDNTVASMISTVAIYELNQINVYLATKLACVRYVAETIQMINKQVNNGSVIWIFMLIIYWMLIPVFIWVAIILFMWKNLRSHWHKVIVPMALAKHCEASGNLLNAKNEIVTMPAYDGALEARFEQTTQSEHDEIDWPEDQMIEQWKQQEEEEKEEKHWFPGQKSKDSKEKSKDNKEKSKDKKEKPKEKQKDKK